MIIEWVRNNNESSFKIIKRKYINNNYNKYIINQLRDLNNQKCEMKREE